MRFSPVFKSSSHCIASPDGRLIATLFPSRVVVRSVQTLQRLHEFSLPPDLCGPVSTFLWSPSSLKLLAAAGDQIHVFSAVDSSFRAVIQAPASSAARPTFTSFGPDDGSICVCSAFGLKFALFNLSASKAVEINNPKFHQALSAPRGFSFRPSSSHLAILTRNAGRDTISIHSPITWEVQRSWHPDLVDAQGLTWTSEGRWLVVWESAAHGHKLLFYTPDGHLFRTWNGPHDDESTDSTDLTTPDLKHLELGAGVKHCQLSPDGMKAALCGYTRLVWVVDVTAATAETMRLQHPTAAISPRDSLQIWQEQLTHAQLSGSSGYPFVRATQPVSPPGRPSASGAPSEVASGGVSAAFDASSALVATRTEDNPSTVWIWDISAAELRAVLIFHATVSSVHWHPSIQEVLLITCQGEKQNMVFVWDPLSGGPGLVDFAQHLTVGQGGAGKTHASASWVDLSSASATLLLGDGSHYMLVSVADSDDSPTAWQGANVSPSAMKNSTEDSTLEQAEADLMAGVDDDASDEMDDTFSFKRTPA